MVLFVLSQDVLQAVTPFLQGWLNGGYFGPESSLASVEWVELKLPGFESFPQPGHRCNTFEPWVLFAFLWNPFDFKGVKDDTETWAPIFDSPRHFSLCRITSPFTCYLLRGWLQGLGKCLPLSVTQYSGLKCWIYYYLLLKMSLLAEIMHWPHWFFKKNWPISWD